MPDEPIWGHFLRFTRVNGLRNVPALKAKIPALEYPGCGSQALLRTAIVEHLAGGKEKRKLYEYFQAHSSHSQVLRMERWLFRWRYMLNRWAFHNADFYQTPLAVRVCPACANEDAAIHGFTWFRRTHQLPGVEWCLRHSQFLKPLPAPMKLLNAKSWQDLKIPSAQVLRGDIPPFINRYVLALEWLTKQGGSAIPAHRFAASLDRLGSEVKGNWSAPPFRWCTDHFTNPDASSRAISCFGRSTLPGLAIKAAQLTFSIDDVARLTQEAERFPVPEEDEIYARYLKMLDLDGEDPCLELEELIRDPWPYHHYASWSQACVGLVEEMKRYSLAHH